MARLLILANQPLFAIIIHCSRWFLDAFSDQTTDLQRFAPSHQEIAKLLRDFPEAETPGRRSPGVPGISTPKKVISMRWGRLNQIITLPVDT